jgi:tetratricopeptide (TPR) repeat protein
VLQQADAARQSARHAFETGRFHEALDLYRAAIEASSRDWQLIWEAADFVMTHLRDFETAANLARQALELNPWYAAGLWNLLGDSLAGLRRPQDAHECYLQADRIQPDDAETNLKLAGSWLMQGDLRRSLNAIARGLANDSHAMFRHLLLKKQEEAISALTVRWNAERTSSLRRSMASARSS